MTYLNEGPAPTWVGQLKDDGGFNCMISVLHCRKIYDITNVTIMVIGYNNVDIMLYCEPTTEGIHDNDYVPLPDHYFINRDYTDKEIIEFLSIFGDPTIMEALIMNDIMFGE